MVDRPSERSDGVRVAEVVAALCLATDLRMGLPFEHGLEATLMTMRLTEAGDVDSDVAAQNDLPRQNEVLTTLTPVENCAVPRNQDS